MVPRNDIDRVSQPETGPLPSGPPPELTRPRLWLRWFIAVTCAWALVGLWNGTTMAIRSAQYPVGGGNPLGLAIIPIWGFGPVVFWYVALAGFQWLALMPLGVSPGRWLSGTLVGWLLGELILDVPAVQDVWTLMSVERPSLVATATVSALGIGTGQWVAARSSLRPVWPLGLASCHFLVAFSVVNLVAPPSFSQFAPGTGVGGLLVDVVSSSIAPGPFMAGLSGLALLGSLRVPLGSRHDSML